MNAAEIDEFVRFMRHVRVGALPGACWEWTGNRPDDRYGHFSVGGNIIKAHRWIYERLVGPIPAGLVLRHRCDNPSCVCPAHLVVGTVADNSRDMIERGRNPNRKGEKHPLAKMGALEIVEIRRLSDIGKTQSEIANLFGISRQQVGKITRRDNWGHIA